MNSKKKSPFFQKKRKSINNIKLISLFFYGSGVKLAKCDGFCGLGAKNTYALGYTLTIINAILLIVIFNYDLTFFARIQVLIGMFFPVFFVTRMLTNKPWLYQTILMEELKNYEPINKQAYYFLINYLKKHRQIDRRIIAAWLAAENSALNAVEGK